MKHYYLGMAASYDSSAWMKHTFSIGHRKDITALQQYLAKRYSGEAILTKNGRSALTLALKAYFDPGDSIIINGFTCYAVYEAITAAKLKPIFADIDLQDLNMSIKTIKQVYYKSSTPSTRIRGIIIQNTLGNPCDIKSIEGFAREHNLTIIEDLAHCAGIRYSNKREAGTVGSACILSFGKDKSIDTVSGGAVIFRHPRKNDIEAPNKSPKPSDHLRARFYPTFGAVSRGLTYIGIGGAFMRGLVKIHWVEKSADNKLDLKRRPSKFEAKLALRQLHEFRRNGEPPLRDFCYVHDRDKLLKELQHKGYYFGGFWYEKPISPTRYYHKTSFPEADCPNAVYAARHIINLPNYYTRRSLTPALKIIKKYLEEGTNGQK